MEPWHYTFQCNTECTCSDGDVQSSLQVLTAVPRALLNPTHPSSSPSFFFYPFSLSINASIFSPSFFICPSDAAAPSLPLPLCILLPPSLSLENEPNGRMSPFQNTSLSWACPIYDGLEQWGIHMREERPILSSPEISPRISRRQRTSSGSCVYRQHSLWKPLTSYRYKF